MVLRRRRAEASCREVARVLQSYLDGYVDAGTAARVDRHLEACRRCGLAADTYERIKAALARGSMRADEDALARLTEFGERLAAGNVA